MRRREKATEVLDARNRELDRTVQQRTAMLFHLSSSLQKVAEREKAALARELHDELGGLLVATKIDISWLRKRVDDGSEATKLRWERVLRCMDEGLALKRRIIESLRPTLLDNVGLVAALRWLVDESLRRQGSPARSSTRSRCRNPRRCPDRHVSRGAGVPHEHHEARQGEIRPDQGHGGGRPPVRYRA